MDPDKRITVEEALHHPWISVCILNLAYTAGAKRGRGGEKSAKGRRSGRSAVVECYLRAEYYCRSSGVQSYSKFLFAGE